MRFLGKIRKKWAKVGSYGVEKKLMDACFSSVKTGGGGYVKKYPSSLARESEFWKKKAFKVVMMWNLFVIYESLLT